MFFQVRTPYTKWSTGLTTWRFWMFKMPGISGVALKQKLDQLCSGLKVIFLTGHGGKINPENQKGDEAVYLAKPLQIDSLVQNAGSTNESIRYIAYGNKR